MGVEFHLRLLEFPSIRPFYYNPQVLHLRESVHLHTNDIALQVVDVGVHDTVILHHRRAALCIVEEVQLVRPARQLRDGLAVQLVVGRGRCLHAMLVSCSVFKERRKIVG